jgi:flavin-dependent dehydrogenase
LMRIGVRQLAKLGVLSRVKKAGTQRVSATTFYYGSEKLEIPVRPQGEVDGLYAPRRFFLDQLLTDRAAECGADVALGYRADSLLWHGERVCGVMVVGPGGSAQAVHADWVVGADGATSSVARFCGAETWRTGIQGVATLYAHLPLRDLSYHWVFQEQEAQDLAWTGGVIPSSGGQACVFVGTQRAAFAEHFRPDPAAAFGRLLPYLSPSLRTQLATQLHAPLAVQHFWGRIGKIRRPIGPGWALVGDALCYKDPATAHGMSNALRDAQLLALELVSKSSAGIYQHALLELSVPIFELTEKVVRLDWSHDRLRAAHVELSQLMKKELSFLNQLDSSDPFLPASPIDPLLTEGSGKYHPLQTTANTGY